jgi:CTP synthase (UTP-ammonia lyase)
LDLSNIFYLQTEIRSSRAYPFEEAHQMQDTLALAIVGEFTPSFLPHTKTEEALEHMRAALRIDIRTIWISTADLVARADSNLARFDAIWIAPGSPYKTMQGALDAIRYAREARKPTLGTCGGCQHMVIEYARNVLGFRDAHHAEYDPYASSLFVTPTSCSLVGQTMQVLIAADSRVAAIYRETTTQEQYYCNFGINPSHQEQLDHGGFRIVGKDADGEARILELPGHPFFVATLFVPQLTSTFDRPHPIIVAFLRAAQKGKLGA